MSLSSVGHQHVVVSLCLICVCPSSSCHQIKILVLGFRKKKTKLKWNVFCYFLVASLFPDQKVVLSTQQFYLNLLNLVKTFLQEKHTILNT